MTQMLLRKATRFKLALCQYVIKQSIIPLFCRLDQFSRNSYADDTSLLVSLTSFILHDVLASRHLHISMLRNDYTVPTR
jgi:hypothetical protein